MRVLAVGAHPDDLELLCGGTLARFVAEGHHVTMCHVSRGDRGSYLHGMAEIAAIRETEAAAAADQLGAAAHISLGMSDGEVNAADPVQRKVAVGLVRDANPDLIITHDPGDYMSDHVETARLVEDASFLASLPLFAARNSTAVRVPALCHMDTVAGIGFDPDEYVDISEFINQKLAALQAHRSQVDWIRDHDHTDLIEQARIACAYRGVQAGVDFAEAFRTCHKSLRTRTRRLLP